MKASQSNEIEEGAKPARSQALADGVFAIVMTLLVLELAVPAAWGTKDEAEVAHKLLEMWGEFLFYGLSFLILGIYWLMHHILFDPIKKYDPTLVWLNVLYLMFVALIPFSTSLYGRIGSQTISAVFYGANLFLIYLMGFAIFSYSTKNKRLVGTNYDSKLIKGGKLMGLVYFVILGAAIGIAFINPLISTIIYASMAGLTILLSSLGQVEFIWVWRTRK